MGTVSLPDTHLWYQPSPLQVYVLLACQQQNSGGLKDKPGKSPDFYHTCYALSGVAASQYGSDGDSVMVGEGSASLERIDVFYNVLLEKSERKCAYFDSLPPLEVDGRIVHGAEGVGVVEGRRRLLSLLSDRAS